MSAAHSPTPQQPTTPKAPYSSVVKKTTGGPSGSLTSEGTEYDESSGDEPAQEETKEGGNPPEPKKFLAPHQSHGVVQHKTDKPLSMDQGRGRETVIESSVTTKGSKSFGTSSARFTATSFQQTDSLPSVQDMAASTVIPQSVQDTPYLEPQIPRGASSQPQDAWPEMPQASSTAIPPQNTMIYAAVMTNRSKQDPESPITTSSTHTAFPYSSGAAADKPHFPNSFSPQHVMGSHPAASSPKAFSAVSNLQPLVQPCGRSMSSHAMLEGNGAGLGFAIPGSSHHHAAIPHTRSQFQSDTLPLSYGLLPLGSRTGSEVYSTAMLPRAGNSPQVVGVGGGGGFNSTRSPRAIEGTTANSLGATKSMYHTTSTVAATREVRNMLGIQSRQQLSSNLPVFMGNSNFPASVSTSYIHPVTPGPTTTDSFTQTEPPATSAKEVQVGRERSSQGVQTAGAPRSDSEAQTSGVFVPVASFTPVQDLQIESVGEYGCINNK